MTESVESSLPYSQAYEKLVQDDEDLIGLLAYALYKKAIREAARQGRLPQSSAQRSPVATEIAAFRGAADSKLTKFADYIVEQSRGDIVSTALRNDFQAMESRLSVDFRRATSWKAAIAVNLLAWLLSIAITFLIAVSGVPHWIAAIAHATGG